jgi:hypothetical protein
MSAHTVLTKNGLMAITSDIPKTLTVIFTCMLTIDNSPTTPIVQLNGADKVMFGGHDIWREVAKPESNTNTDSRTGIAFDTLKSEYRIFEAKTGTDASVVSPTALTDFLTLQGNKLLNSSGRYVAGNVTVTGKSKFDYNYTKGSSTVETKQGFAEVELSFQEVAPEPQKNIVTEGTRAATE